VEFALQTYGKKDRRYQLAAKNLAQLHDNQNQAAKAVPILREVVELSEAAFGVNDQNFNDDSSDFMYILNRAANELVQSGDVPAARELRQQLLKLRIRHLGADHWETTNARVELSEIDILEQLTPAQREQLRSADELFNKVVALDQQHRYQDALKVAEQVVEIRLKILGEAQRSTESGLYWQGYLQNEVGEYQLGEQSLKRAVSVC
jgi:tetratricopeptide (TPR) repeat protein